jgi:hypothetical protein
MVEVRLEALPPSFGDPTKVHRTARPSLPKGTATTHTRFWSAELAAHGGAKPSNGVSFFGGGGRSR